MTETLFLLLLKLTAGVCMLFIIGLACYVAFIWLMCAVIMPLQERFTKKKTEQEQSKERIEAFLKRNNLTIDDIKTILVLTMGGDK